MNALLLFVILAAASFRLWLLVPLDAVPASGGSLWQTANDEVFVSVTLAENGQLELMRTDGQTVELAVPACQLFAWDPDAPVYVNAGLDGKPGVVGVDDDGNATVDDPSELGATGSDDVMLTPDHPDHAAAGEVTSRLLSRGAMRPVTRPQTLRGPTQIRLDALQEKRLISKIVDLVPSPSDPRADLGQGSALESDGQ